MATPTVHNPTHFEPADYEVVDYLDNKRPVYYGQGIEAFEAEVKWWETEMATTFGLDWRRKIHRCVHCGNGRVRWITATRHIPTGDTVVFGSDCTERLGFVNRVAFKLALLKSKAEAGHARLKVWNARVRFLEANPAFATAIEAAKGELHAKNLFVHDVIAKLNQFGSLSERQVAAVLGSLKRDVEKATAPVEVKGDAPSGRVTVTGTILTTKTVHGDYGSTEKMLLGLPNGARVWLTLPGKARAGRGDTITVTATFEVSRDDKSFGFGKRPTLVSEVLATPAAA